MLETEIKKLSSQIEQLNNNFEQFFSSATQNAPVDAPKSDQLEPETPDQNDTPKITPDSLRGLCMVKSREGRKTEVRAILTDLGAKVVDDLSPENLKKAYEKIGAL